MQEIARKVRRVQSRMVVNRFLDAWALMLMLVASALVAYVLADRLFFIGLDPMIPFGAGLGLSLLGAGLLTWIYRPRFLSAAIRTDEQMGLKERVSSVLSIGAFETEMEQALYADTVARLNKLALASAAPIELPRRARWVPVPVAAAILCLFLPNWDVLERKAAKAKEAFTVAEVQKQAEQLKKTSQLLKEKAKGEEMKEVQQIASDMEKLTAEMKKGIPKKDDAMAKLSSIADQVKQRQDALSDKKAMANDMKNAMSKAAGEKSEMEKKLQEGKFGEVAKDLEQKMKDLQDGKMSEEAKQQLAKDLQQMADSMKDMPGLQSLQKAAENAGQQLQSQDPKQQQQAANDLANMKQQLSDLSKAQKESEALDQASSDLKQMQDQLSQSDQQTCPDCGAKQDQGQCPNQKEGGS